MPTRNFLIRVFAAVAIFAGISITVIATDNDRDGRTDRVEVTVTLPSGDLDPDPERASKPGSPEASLRDESPDEVPQTALQEAREANTEVERNLSEPQPKGGAQNYACRKDFSGAVYSARNGADPLMWVNHYTVSQNVSGWGDVYAIRDYFKRTRIASATFIVDFEGHCLQMVPISQKPWTQGYFNPWSISVEIIATGRETRAQWLASPLIKGRVLSELARDTMRSQGIPLRRVDPVGCKAQLGWTDHNALECGNDHTDVSPSFPYATFQRQLVEQDVQTKRLLAARRSHRIAHAKLVSRRCRVQKAPGCAILRARNRALHERYGKALG